MNQIDLLGRLLNQEDDLKRWAGIMGRNDVLQPFLSGYDYQSWFQNTPYQGRLAGTPFPMYDLTHRAPDPSKLTHLSDIGKLPWHPTFSQESMYSRSKSDPTWFGSVYSRPNLKDKSQ